MKKMIFVFTAAFTLAFGAVGVYAAEKPDAECATMQHNGNVAMNMESMNMNHNN